jgi:hypothetical protein
VIVLRPTNHQPQGTRPRENSSRGCSLQILHAGGKIHGDYFLAPVDQLVMSSSVPGRPSGPFDERS